MTGRKKRNDPAVVAETFSKALLQSKYAKAELNTLRARRRDQIQMDVGKVGLSKTNATGNKKSVPYAIEYKVMLPDS